ncbi:type VI secretion system baseplate subunit TssG [Spirosoma sp.]|uniref:type VI secretion system baseplate subunit TssG n=1 Tax=Spirosoma sp. TaxID=1899569 RepID=UPI00260C4265|nr:type VI secretion system baseplate subunit TssG [Spirosoma sp.]MCX6216964.1 type VI secretion system baseplate subunit TssG [Spirosoma sp.]
MDDFNQYGPLLHYQQEVIGLNQSRAIGESPVDLRLEVILAELAHQGLDPLRDVLIHSWSLFERDYRNDVDLDPERILIGDARCLDKLKERVKIGHASANESGLPKPDWDYEELERQQVFLNLVVHRDSLYDYLPEGLFHQPVNKTRDRDQSDWAIEIAEQFRREQAARRFFQPIEQEFYHQRLLLELEERKYLLTEENLRQNDKGETLRDFWQLPFHLLNIRQVANLLHLLPIVHRIVGDTELVAQAFRLLLGVPVNLETIPPINCPIDENRDASQETSRWIGPEPDELGRLSLGNFSLGGYYQDTMPALQLSLGPLSTDQLIYFLPGQDGSKLLDLLVGYFIPAEVTVVTHLLPDERNKYLYDDTPTSILGFAAYI